MQQIMFTFRPGLSADEHVAAQDRIRHIHGVIDAKPLLPNIRNEALRRSWFLYAGSDQDPHDIVEELRTFEEVEEAHVPTQRQLIE